LARQDDGRRRHHEAALVAQMSVPPRAECLRRAEALTCGPRVADYGDPVINLSRVAAMWSAYLGHPITGQQVAVCLALLKIARLRASPDHQDSHDDAAAYLAIAWECAVHEAFE
jgi:hypothetical protein